MLLATAIAFSEGGLKKFGSALSSPLLTSNIWTPRLSSIF